MRRPLAAAAALSVLLAGWVAGVGRPQTPPSSIYSATATSGLISIDALSAGVGAPPLLGLVVAPTSASVDSAAPASQGRSRARGSNLTLASGSTTLATLLTQAEVSAPPGGRVARTFLALPVPPLLGLSAGQATAYGHWAGKSVCHTFDPILARGTSSTLDAYVGATGADSALLQVAGTAASTSSVSLVGGGRFRPARAVASTSLSSLRIAGAIQVDVISPPLLSAIAPGLPGGGAVTFTAPVLTVSLGGAPAIRLDAAASPLDIAVPGNPALNVRLALGKSESTISPDGTRATGEASLLTVQVQLAGVMLLDARVAPLTAAAAVPAGGVKCPPAHSRPPGPDDSSDPDGDGLGSAEEHLELGSDPGDADTDGDGVDDATEKERGTDHADADSDDDGLDDRVEHDVWGTDPRNPDTDGDGRSDGTEVHTDRTDPSDPKSHQPTTGGDPAVDSDGDGLSDGEELAGGSDPGRPDTDGDGVPDGAEQERGTSPTRADTDRDGIRDGDEDTTDPTDPDSDDDGLDDGLEEAWGTDPLRPDTDGDGASDGVEVNTDATDPVRPQTGQPLPPEGQDSDGDGLPDRDERELGTDPAKVDTDGDGLSDGTETDSTGTDPADNDTDGDGLDDGREIRDRTDALEPDTDGDGRTDRTESEVGTSPRDWDSDGDGLGDGIEVNTGTNPTSGDTDGGGADDGAERDSGTDPKNPADDSAATPGGPGAGREDSDGDGLSDGAEPTLGTDPDNPDSDGDGLPDGDEIGAGTGPNDPDSDGDGLSDGEEVGGHLTDPKSTDTDNDGLPDNEEVSAGLDPKLPDSDGDGLEDGAEENTVGSDPAVVDTDGGGVPDGVEVDYGLDPTDPGDDNSLVPAEPDVDVDGVSDEQEPGAGLDPKKRDTDGDGLSDGSERSTFETDPTDPDTDKDGTSDGDEVGHGTDPNGEPPATPVLSGGPGPSSGGGDPSGGGTLPKTGGSSAPTAAFALALMALLTRRALRASPRRGDLLSTGGP